MIDLNDAAAIHAADPYHLLGHISNLPQQIEDAWAAADAVDLPKSFHALDRVVIAGMGSSASGGSLLQALMQPESQLPLFISRDYELPAYAAGSNTLVIASSYSGNTEETLAAIDQARSRNCQILVMTKGGRLGHLAQDLHLPRMPIHSESPPHAALGWLFAPLLNVAARLGWLHDPKDDLAEALEVLRVWGRELAAESPVAKNLAKREAGQLMGRMVFVLGAGRFAEVARYWKDRMNLTAKAWAAWAALPEADHNLLAGTEWPDGFASKVMALFLTGASDQPRHARRVELTRRALMMAGCNTDSLIARGQSPLAQMLSLVQLGDFMNFYLALLNGAEPTQIEAVEEFKAEMAAE